MKADGSITALTPSPILPENNSGVYCCSERRSSDFPEIVDGVSIASNILRMDVFQLLMTRPRDDERQTPPNLME